jgi:hypothetical protein
MKKYCKRQVPDESTICKNYLDACYQSVNTKVHSVLYGIYSEQLRLDSTQHQEVGNYWTFPVGVYGHFEKCKSET